MANQIFSTSYIRWYTMLQVKATPTLQSMLQNLAREVWG